MTAIISSDRLDAEKFIIQGSETQQKKDSDEEDLDVPDEDDDFGQD